MNSVSVRINIGERKVKDIIGTTVRSLIDFLKMESESCTYGKTDIMEEGKEFGRSPFFLLLNQSTELVVCFSNSLFRTFFSFLGK